MNKTAFFSLRKKTWGKNKKNKMATNNTAYDLRGMSTASEMMRSDLQRASRIVGGESIRFTRAVGGAVFPSRMDSYSLPDLMKDINNYDPRGTD